MSEPLREPWCPDCRELSSGDCGLHGAPYAYEPPPESEGVTYTSATVIPGPGWPDLSGLLREVRAVPGAWHALPADLQRRITAALESESEEKRR